MKTRKRLYFKNYDYSSKKTYFVTICSKDKGEIFGSQTDNDQVFLNDIGLIIKNQWEYLEKQYPYISLDEFIIMPDLLHGIIWINDISFIEYSRNCTQQWEHSNNSIQEQKIKNVYELIGTFKTTSTKLIHKYCYKDFKWQKSFYDRIIRDEDELYDIRNYVRNNALKEKIGSSEQSPQVVNNRGCSLHAVNYKIDRILRSN